MVKGKSKFMPVIAAVVDVLLMLLAFWVAKWNVFEGPVPERYFYGIAGVGCIALWIGIAAKIKLYEVPRILFIHKVLSKNLYAVFIFSFLSAGLIFFITDYKYSRDFFICTIGLFLVFVVLWRILAFALLKSARQKGFNFRRVLLVGYNNKLRDLIDQVYLKPSYGFKVVGLFTNLEPQGLMDTYYLGKLEEVFNFLETDKVDEIVVSVKSGENEFIQKLLQFADNHMIRVRILPRFSEYLNQAYTIDYTANIPILNVRKEPLQSFTNRFLKRIFDFVFSLMLIIFVFSWLFPILALIIKLESKGPVFFRQDRTGRDGASFPCYKFRSMTVNADSDKVQATRDDKRITKFGAFMRKTSLDELPQFFNVLMNEMSIVGPRPHMLKHTEEYRLLVDKYMVRHFAKPGVTGWAQINGFRGETKTVDDMANRAQADIWYIENWSFLLDMKIVFSTAMHMFWQQDENAF